MGLALKRLGLGGRIVGVSRSETIAQALELGVIDEGWGYDELQQVLKGSRHLQFSRSAAYKRWQTLSSLGPRFAWQTLNC